MPKSAAAKSRRLPFAVDHAAGVNLVDQVAAGLQGAIQSGAYGPGERLPRTRELASGLGVSLVVAHQAVRRLAADGLLVARRKTGIRVAATHEKVWRAHVLWLTAPPQSFYFAARQAALLQRLEAADVRTTAVSPAADAQGEWTQVQAALATMSITLVICAVGLPGLEEDCRRRGVPLVTIDDAYCPSSAGHLTQDREPALVALAEHCRALGITRPAVLGPVGDLSQRVVDVFARHGLTLAPVPMPDSWRGEGMVETLENVGYDATVRLLAAGPLPQLLYVADDYAARGCLTALLLAGVRIPADLQLVIWSNRFHHPTYPVEFTRLELDPMATGTNLADLALAVLAGDRRTPLTVSLPPRFIVGQTTAPRPATASRARRP